MIFISYFLCCLLVNMQLSTSCMKLVLERPVMSLLQDNKV